VKWVEKYLSIPFRDGGRSKRGVDCWGLVRLVYSQELKIELAEHADIPAKNLIAVARAISTEKDGEEWFPVAREDLKEFDIVVMTQYGGKTAAHVGIYVSPGKVLHSETGCNTVLIDTTHVTVRERIKWLRRHKTQS